jgi:hypothetical protein
VIIYSYALYKYLFENEEGVSVSDVNEQMLEIADALLVTDELSLDNHAKLSSMADSIAAETGDDSERVAIWIAVFNAESFGLADTRIDKIKSFLDSAMQSSESAQSYASRYSEGIATFVTDTLADVKTTVDKATEPTNWILPVGLAATGYLLLKKVF